MEQPFWFRNELTPELIKEMTERSPRRDPGSLVVIRSTHFSRNTL